MSFKYNVSKFPVAGTSKLLATQGGKHIFNILLSTDAWNGALVKKGAYGGFEYYAEDTASTFEGIVIDQAANGNWYVEVTNPGDAILIYNPPVVEAEYNKDFSSEKSFYLKAGEIGRGHELAIGDVFELSADGFSGTASKGATVNGVTGKKPVISSASV